MVAAARATSTDIAIYKAENGRWNLAGRVPGRNDTRPTKPIIPLLQSDNFVPITTKSDKYLKETATTQKTTSQGGVTSPFPHDKKVAHDRDQQHD